MTEVVRDLEIEGLPKFISGKVREVFDLGSSLLIVVTDRLSAFDVVLPTPIPGKGVVLTQLSLFWFQQTRQIMPNHLLSVDPDVMVDAITVAGGVVTAQLRMQLFGRSMLVKKAAALPIECVARGYLSGSLWKEYKKLFAHGGEHVLNGETLPVGLRESDRLPATLFTPATKALSGHDENISYADAAAVLGAETAAAVRDRTLALYTFASGLALPQGLIIADTKFEFGVLDGQLILIDEALTPDSSRFWDAKFYKPGRPQPSFDKQFVRDYLETLDWDKSYPAPALPDAIVEKTSAKYREAYTRITGLALRERL